MENKYHAALQQISKIPRWRPVGRVCAIQSNTVCVRGFTARAHLGDQVSVQRDDGETVRGEIIQITQDWVDVMLHGELDMISMDARVLLEPHDGTISPAIWWIGRIVDPFGLPLDGLPLLQGKSARAVQANAPLASTRARLGPRLGTGLAALNTFLPLVQGQRLGLFAGSGVGKSSMLAALSSHVEADVVVIAMIGERGRELRQFVEETLGPHGMSRAVVVAATSDQPALLRRRCATSAMAVAEHFRAEGKNVLFLADSITRFAEAHREIALETGELPTLRGFPASVSQRIMSLCERAGPGPEGEGAITAIFSVLVAGSDFDEPVADILRGTLDGHIVLDRQIAERGRYPAINISKSVSRSLPQAATRDENEVLKQARHLLAVYENSEVMVKAALYTEGTDPALDRAVLVWDELDRFIAKQDEPDIDASFDKLRLILRRAGPA